MVAGANISTKLNTSLLQRHSADGWSDADKAAGWRAAESEVELFSPPAMAGMFSGNAYLNLWEENNPDSMEFTAIIENFNTRLWTYHLKVPNPVAKQFQEQGVRRVVCTLNKTMELQCAIMSAGDGVHFILINKKIRDQLKLKEGSKVEVNLTKDESEFGLPFPAELEEVLAQDKEGKEYFDKLTPGKQRNIIYAAGQVKNPDLRIQRAMVMVEHLKKNKGKIDFKQLYAELKTTP